MPNWVYNEVVMSKNVYNAIKTERFFDNGTMEETFDFNSLIPEPKTIEECDPRYILSDDKSQMFNTSNLETDDRSWFNWYSWRCDNWGTKWNAADVDIYEMPTEEIKICFNTAWSPAEPIFIELCKRFPNEPIFGYLEEESNAFGPYEWSNNNGEYSAFEIDDEDYDED